MKWRNLKFWWFLTVRCIKKREKGEGRGLYLFVGGCRSFFIHTKMTKSSLNAIFIIWENKAILFLKNGGHITYLQGAAKLPLFLFVSFERNPFLFGLRLPLNALNCKHIHLFTKSRFFSSHMTLPFSPLNTWTPPPQYPPLSTWSAYILFSSSARSPPKIFVTSATDDDKRVLTYYPFFIEVHTKLLLDLFYNFSFPLHHFCEPKLFFLTYPQRVTSLL